METQCLFQTPVQCKILMFLALISFSSINGVPVQEEYSTTGIFPSKPREHKAVAVDVKNNSISLTTIASDSPEKQCRSWCVFEFGCGDGEDGCVCEGGILGACVPADEAFLHTKINFADTV